VDNFNGGEKIANWWRENCKLVERKLQTGGEKIANWWRENCKLVESVDMLYTSMLKYIKN